MTRGHLLAVLSLVCALVAAGCGGGGGAAAGDGSAGVVPAGVPVYVSLDTDFDGEQIEQARALLARFPGSAGALGMLEAEFRAEDLDFQEDVRPALGPRVDIVLLDVPQDGSDATAVVLLQPEDDAKLDALLARAEDTTAVKTEVDGWTAVADDQATLDRFAQGRENGSLEDSDAFEEAMEDLEEDALVRAYFDTRALSQVAAAEAPIQGQLDQLVQVSAVGAATRAEEDGFRLEAAARTDQELQNFEPSLPSELPGGAFAYAGFGNLADGLRDGLNRAGEENPELDQQIAQLELALGLSLDQDVLPLFEQETGIAVYPAASGTVPSFVLALRVEDEQQAIGTIDRVFERAAQLMPGVPQPTTTSIEGLEAREVDAGGMSILYAAFNGKLVVTNDGDLLAEANGDGPKLADDEVYGNATELAELPDEVQSLVYVNLNEGPEYAFELAEQNGEPVPPQVRENVEPLESLLLYGTSEDDGVRVSGFLALGE